MKIGMICDVLIIRADMMTIYLIAFFGIVAVVGVGAMWFSWRLSRGIKSIWLRHLPRAMVAAAAFTPTIAPIPGLHGAIPVPASWLFTAGIFQSGSEERMLALRYGGIPLLIAFLVYWLVSVGVSCARQARVESRPAAVSQ